VGVRWWAAFGWVSPDPTVLVLMSARMHHGLHDVGADDLRRPQQKELFAGPDRSLASILSILSLAVGLVRSVVG
jgi:hypothetical protein